MLQLATRRWLRRSPMEGSTTRPVRHHFGDSCPSLAWYLALQPHVRLAVRRVRRILQDKAHTHTHPHSRSVKAQHGRWVQQHATHKPATGTPRTSVSCATTTCRVPSGCSSPVGPPDGSIQNTAPSVALMPWNRVQESKSMPMLDTWPRELPSSTPTVSHESYCEYPCDSLFAIAQNAGFVPPR